MSFPSRLFLTSPIIRRVAWHVRRMGGQVDRRFFLSLAQGIVGFVALAALLVTAIEKTWTIEALFDSFNWGFATVLGQGDAGYVSSLGGRIVSWLLILFGVALLGTVTGALVAIVIDFLLKEGQGMGAAGYRDHVVVCGWNTTARDLIEELRGDDYKSRIVLVHEADKNPAGDGVYFVKGDPTNTDDLERAGIKDASAALIFPSEPTNDADMRSILTIMAIESVAPGVRTVAEVNNPRHVEHFRRARVDEVLVTSRLASRLLARSALYPGLTELVTDIVSGGGLRAVPGRPAAELSRPVGRRGQCPPAHGAPGDAAGDLARDADDRQPADRLPAAGRRRWPGRGGVAGHAGTAAHAAGGGGGTGRHD
jgi:voltage-gated potassium channel